MSEAGAALDALRADGFAMGEGFERAHAIAKAHEGEAPFDWIHALCHRIEGDAGNANYWYRRAGRPPFDGGFEAEADAIAAELGR
ncbi:hypothetical protein [Roseitalea porphyridii]|uniref:hypothetical protein n=1 Tax=Roseitalea porphyridii TaxID=1852022 RepID=UPI003D18589B